MARLGVWMSRTVDTACLGICKTDRQAVVLTGPIRPVGGRRNGRCQAASSLLALGVHALHPQAEAPQPRQVGHHLPPAVAQRPVVLPGHDQHLPLVSPEILCVAATAPFWTAPQRVARFAEWKGFWHASPTTARWRWTWPTGLSAAWRKGCRLSKPCAGTPSPHQPGTMLNRDFKEFAESLAAQGVE